MNDRSRRAQLIANELEELAHRVSRFPATLARTVDDVEVWVLRSSHWGHRLSGRRTRPELSLSRDRIAFRVLKDGLVGHASCTRVDETLWRACVERALGATLPGGPRSCPVPRTPQPGPLTFDPDLADALAAPRELARIADALTDNLWHEAERADRLRTLEGQVGYDLRRYVIGNKGGVAASLHGDLSAEVRLDRTHGDAYHVVHAPDSFQPLALLGARTLRNMPAELAAPRDLRLAGRVPVVLHPRAFEAILRRLVVPLFTQSARRTGLMPFRDGERVAHDSLTLVDDAGMDGLASSRHFDDEGMPTRRNALIVRGRVAMVLEPRNAETGQGGTASQYRRPQGLEDPQDAALHEAGASLLVERGDLGFHEMIAAEEKAVLVHELLGLHGADAPRTRFACGIGSGITLERGRESRRLAPGEWQVSGSVLSLPGGPAGFLSDVVLSRELYDTGTAILPYCLTHLEV
jgi:predicted Zn-dependent protease